MRALEFGEQQITGPEVGTRQGHGARARKAPSPPVKDDLRPSVYAGPIAQVARITRVGAHRINTSQDRARTSDSDKEHRGEGEGTARGGKCGRGWDQWAVVGQERWPLSIGLARSIARGNRGCGYGVSADTRCLCGRPEGMTGRQDV
ncbi:hypothetical protein GY45DRAFT_231822 [Cubamyces sp. BRFM 1775]|nr:hypothetical protein GY45DRAFT_231822 [Cubamyces sp. BRFM 1775]